MNYWKEGVIAALEEAGIEGWTDEQADIMARVIEGGVETYDLYTGRECIPDPRDEELARLRKKQDTVVILKCKSCSYDGESEEFRYLGDGVSACPKCSRKYTSVHRVIQRTN